MNILKTAYFSTLLALVSALAMQGAYGQEQPAAKPAQAAPTTETPGKKEAGNQEAGNQEAGNEEADAKEAGNKQAKEFAPPAGLAKLSKQHRVWLDVKNKQVIIDGYVALTDGQLEMFACPAGTKEHESLIAVYSTAQLAHTALLATGALAGSPVKFRPNYMPASGAVVDIDIQYHDTSGEVKTVAAQHWIKNVKTAKQMQHSWVFAGSGFWQDPQDGKRYYHADGGDFICVSNFPTATLDLPIKSSQANSSLLFSVFKERVPPRRTPVRLILKPKVLKLKPIEAGTGKVKPDDPFNKKPLKDPFKN